MSNEKKNMDIFFEERIKRSLHNRVSDGFTNNLMQQIELEQKFATEDKKTDRLVTYVIGAFSAILVAFAVVLGITIAGKNDVAGVSESWFSNFSFYLETYTARVLETFGVSVSVEYILFAVIIGVFIFLFSGADRLILRKK